jgi:TM2 domain-containing membrane protein YozV
VKMSPDMARLLLGVLFILVTLGCLFTGLHILVTGAVKQNLLTVLSGVFIIVCSAGPANVAEGYLSGRASL